MLYSSEYHEDKPDTVNKRKKYESDKDKQRYKSDDRINDKTKIKIYNIITYSTSFRRYFFIEEKIYPYTYDTEKSSWENIRRYMDNFDNLYFFFRVSF